MGNRRYQLHPAPICPKQINYPSDELSHYLPHLKLKAFGHEKKKVYIIYTISEKVRCFLIQEKRSLYPDTAVLSDFIQTCGSWAVLTSASCAWQC